MYSIFFSRVEKGINVVADRLKKIIPANARVVILPWGFPYEISSCELMENYFSKEGQRYQRVVDSLRAVGIEDYQIQISDCYGDSQEKIKNMINNSDILFLLGGNPEMFFKKVVHDTETLYDIKHYKGIIMGESAGAELQLERYFITAKNNYYKYQAFYDGFGAVDNPFYFDVHSIDEKTYLNDLQAIANERRKNVYAIFDEGALLYDRRAKRLETFGHVIGFIPL